MTPTATHPIPTEPQTREHYEEMIVDRLAAQGYVVIPEVLSPREIERLRAAAAEVSRAALVAAPEREAPMLPGAVHALGAAFAHPEFTRLATDPRLVSLIAAALTPNIHVYHSHLDIHPPEPPAPTAWRWHEDGGRMSADIETRIRLSLKVCYWLSDVEAPGLGNMEVIPGSHRWTKPLPRTPGTPPAGAVPVLARAGDAVLFDRRIWHGRGTNRSERTRAAVFFAYTPRWIAQRETGSAAQLAAETSPFRRQLLGCADWDTCHVARKDLPVARLLDPDSTLAAA
jgi:ectoine hydroxylase